MDKVHNKFRKRDEIINICNFKIFMVWGLFFLFFFKGGTKLIWLYNYKDKIEYLIFKTLFSTLSHTIFMQVMGDTLTISWWECFKQKLKFTFEHHTCAWKFISLHIGRWNSRITWTYTIKLYVLYHTWYWYVNSYVKITMIFYNFYKIMMSHRYLHIITVIPNIHVLP